MKTLFSPISRKYKKDAQGKQCFPCQCHCWSQMSWSWELSHKFFQYHTSCLSGERHKWWACYQRVGGCLPITWCCWPLGKLKYNLFLGRFESWGLIGSIWSRYSRESCQECDKYQEDREELFPVMLVHLNDFLLANTAVTRWVWWWLYPLQGLWNSYGIKAQHSKLNKKKAQAEKIRRCSVMAL